LGLIACLSFACSHGRRDPPAGAELATESLVPTSGGDVRHIGESESGVGWSIAPKTDVAISEVLTHAGVKGTTGLIVIFYTAQHPSEAILSAIRARQGESQRVIGMSSHEGILTAEGYHASPNGVVGALSMTEPGMVIGVGGASLDEAPGGQSARLALRRAARDAGMTTEKPSMVLLFANRGTEEAMLAAITEEIGPDVPLIGGTAAGRAADLAQKRDALAWSTIANGRRMSTGAAVAAFYAKAPFAYTYGGGYNRVSTKHGVVTDADPRVIRAIDGRPALDVYDEWLGGRPKAGLARGEPLKAAWLVKKIEGDGVSHDQFIHVFTRDNSPSVLFAEANVKNGDIVYPAEGSWNILMNRFAVMPREARKAANNMTPASGIFIYCAGALATIPPDQRTNMSYLVSQAIGDLPWLGVFTWGEQGHVPGVGNLHGNLMSSTLLFPTTRNARN
jgi:hypothetical protein